MGDGGHEYVLRVQPLSQVRDRFPSQERLLAALAIAFAVLGLTIAGVGIYGVFSLSVERRTPEIAIRMALGAGRQQIATMVFGDALRLVACGLACGLPTAWLVTRIASAVAYGQTSIGAVPLVTGVTLVTTVAFAAVYLQMRRASSADPLRTLRLERHIGPC